MEISSVVWYIYMPKYFGLDIKFRNWGVSYRHMLAARKA
jgi:hypothetical protein